MRIFSVRSDRIHYSCLKFTLLVVRCFVALSVILKRHLRPAFAVGAPQGCAETPPGAKKCAPCAASCAETPLGRPFGAPQKKRVKKNYHAAVRFFGIFCDFPGRGAPLRGAPCAASPPPGGYKMRLFAAQPRNAAQHYCNGCLRHNFTLCQR